MTPPPFPFSPDGTHFDGLNLLDPRGGAPWTGTPAEDDVIDDNKYCSEFFMADFLGTAERFGFEAFEAAWGIEEIKCGYEHIKMRD